MSTMTKKELIAALKERLATDDRWTLRALTVVYRNQTAAEQASQSTIEHNGIGFSGPDAEILSSFAQQYQRRGSLSPRQMNVLRRKMPSYAGQVLRAADTDRLMAALSCQPTTQAADSHSTPRCLNMKRPIPFLSEALAVLALIRFALRKADLRTKRCQSKRRA